MSVFSRTAVRPLTGSQVARALSTLRQRWPEAEVTAGQQDTDGGGAIVQFHNPAAPFGQHATIHVRWEESRGPWMQTGHYFDDEFAADVDFIYRSRRGY
jgi:hypothetical protein